jgi:hypothetical protein
MMLNAILASLLLLGTEGVSAQAAPGGQHCFSIHVHLNGKTVDGPEQLTLKTPEKETTVLREGNCFNVPPELLKQEKLAVSFALSRDKVDLPAVATGFFAWPWDVELEDKRFDKSVPVPQHARIRETCAVVFHGGEPERALTTTPCRSPLPAKKHP